MNHRDPDGDPTRPNAKVVSGEATLPDEHTRRVEALKKQKEREPERSSLKVHDDPNAPEEKLHKAFDPSKPPPADAAGAPAAAAAAEAPPQRSSTELADRDQFRKQKKRERDRRAERTALGAIILVFLGIGGAGYMITSSMIDDTPREPTKEEIALAKEKAVKAAADRRAKNTSHIDETPDLPALRMMLSEGLTIAAEGLPEVSVSAQTNDSGPLAALETCRFAYGVWEFSPNKRFRFLTTCAAREEQIMVGAYTIDGSTVIMSPLVDGPAKIESKLEVEKPSTMTTHVTYGTLVLDVNQRINTLRGGMEGEAFRATYIPKNTLNPPGTKPHTSKDPLLDAIKQEIKEESGTERGN